MDEMEHDWQITCDRETFEKCKTDAKFPYIVALARSANALNSTHSFLLLAGEEIRADANRDRLNSYFLASATLYEILKLLKAMNHAFANDPIFQERLRPILRNPVAQQIERDHLRQVRHNAVFHFDPEGFKETIEKSGCNECIFIAGRGKRSGNVNYVFADVIASEILVGFAEDSAAFYAALTEAMQNTTKLVVEFVSASEQLISHYLRWWGFHYQKLEN